MAYKASAVVSVFALLLLAVSSLQIQGASAGHDETPRILKVVDRVLTFYVNETESSVVAANMTGAEYRFGTLTVWRSQIRAGPDGSSRLVGGIEGMNAFTGGNKHLVSSVMHIKTGEYEGSVSLLGATSADWKDERKYTVVGGTGSFLYVRGKATFNQAGDGELLAMVELCLRFDV